MKEFPRTTVGGVSLSRMLIGTNWLLGWSHTSVSADEMIRRRYDSSHANLQVLASSVDTLRVFDNTRWYEPVYWRAGSKVLLDEPRYGLHLS